MHTSTIVILAVIVVLVVLAGVIISGRRRSARLRAHFGPEYARTVQDTGGRAKAEAELHEREKRVNAFTIRPLTPADRERYAASWRRIQALFVDNPRDAVSRADELLAEVMTMRGYPANSDLDQRTADLSVHHPVLVQSYRSAHDIATRHVRGEAGTEELRQAMLHYRALFDDLIDTAAEAPLKAAS
jgi:hypothetical protein